MLHAQPLTLARVYLSRHQAVEIKIVVLHEINDVCTK